MKSKKKIHPIHGDVVETASLRLALLKENFRYREFIEENRVQIWDIYHEWRKAEKERYRGNERRLMPQRLAGLLVGPEMKLLTWFCNKLQDDFGIVCPLVIWTTDDAYCEPTADEELDLLDPAKALESIPEKKRETVLRAMFFTWGIMQIQGDDEYQKGPPEWSSTGIGWLNGRDKPLAKKFGGYLKEPNPEPLSGLRSHERVLLVDLRKKKVQLLKEFEAFLDAVEFSRKYSNKPEWIERYSTWKPDTTRARAEAWQHLKVWKLHRLKKGFPDISREMGINPERAKKSFYRAYELIEGHKYDPIIFRKLYRKIGKEDISRTCGKCSDSIRKACGATGTLCPEVLAFVSQDYVRLQEKLLPPEAVDFIGSSDPRPARSTPRKKTE